MSLCPYCRGFALLELMISVICLAILCAGAMSTLSALRDSADVDTARYASFRRADLLMNSLQKDLREATSFYPGASGNGVVLEIPAVDRTGRVIDGTDAVSYSFDPLLKDKLYRTLIQGASTGRQETKQCIAHRVKHLAVVVGPDRLAKIDFRVAAETRRGEVSRRHEAVVFMRNIQKR